MGEGNAVKETYTFVKALNNNVIIAESILGQEVIFIGKGIGFGKKKGDKLTDLAYDKVFSLVNHEEQEKYKRLLKEKKSEHLLIIHEVMEKIRSLIGIDLDERIHFALAQHLVLALERTKQKTDIHNPFLWETKLLYQESFHVAEEVVSFLHQKTGIELPTAEIGFIALHIQSAIHGNANLPHDRTDIVLRVISYVEEKTGKDLNKDSIPFKRFAQHIKEMFERSMTDELDVEEKVIKILKEDNPSCYNIARNIVKMMEKAIQQRISDVEIIYISIHLQRLLKE
ncbi:BglG family transcription antiterminator [Evansella tamaricis]|uniref:PRD domain-containing protein n=1 Tax=Evansella tamaricis TaxID=2069301 RepID=A0ABS6JES1_9BACI|nr:PRD domain-containing protein [Evansella tamaricis]MBU9710960.1 PRD domain-containing protein [Evansella tamaricis]